MGELQEIKKIYFVDRDYERSIERINALWQSQNVNFKHRCSRKPDCNCVEIGSILVEAIELKKINNYYYNFSNEAPFELLLKLCKRLVRQKEYASARSTIKQYILYSKVDKNSGMSSEQVG